MQHRSSKVTPAVFRRASSVILVLLAVPETTTAENDGLYTKWDWPRQVIERPLTLAGSMMEIRGDSLRINLSKDRAGDPVAAAPDIYLGIDDRLTLGVTHDTGFCLRGDTCNKTYNDFAVDALYGLIRSGAARAVARGGLTLPSLSNPFASGVHLGMVLRLVIRNFAIVSEPRIYLGIRARDGTDANPGFPNAAHVPMSVQSQISEQFLVSVSSGVSGELSNFSDTQTIPLSAGFVFAVNERFDLGAELGLDNAFGTRSTTDQRTLVARAALRL